jgi:hypothetical protein
MFSLNRKFFLILGLLTQLMVQINAEATSYVVCVNSWSPGIAVEKLNDELYHLQTQAYEDGKFFELVKVTITSPMSTVLYNISDKMDETNPFMTKIEHIPLPKGFFLGTSLEVLQIQRAQQQLHNLQEIAANQGKAIKIKELFFTPSYQGIIIYEIER